MIFIEHCALGNYKEVDKTLKNSHFSVAYIEHALQRAALEGQPEIIQRLLQDNCVDPSSKDNFALRQAAANGHLAVIEFLLQDRRVDPSADKSHALRWSAKGGHLAVVERLLQDVRIDPSAENNYAVQWAAKNGHVAVVERLLQDKRVNPSAYNNLAVRWAARNGHFSVVDILVDDSRTSFSEILESCLPEEKKYFEYRNRFTEICIALQNLNLPAWITMLIIRASYPWNILPIHNQWKLVCAVKHFHKN